jgi:hypothetical protein
MQGFLFREHVIMCLMAGTFVRQIFSADISNGFFSNVHIEGHVALEPDPETELRSRSGKVLPRCTPCVLRLLEIKKMLEYSNF